jgi:nicotinamide mononucleotide (NMN) deamidase PncC
MANGARLLFDADLAISVTGIAGPGGDVPGKPSGTVFLHLSARDGYEAGERHLWPADRSANKLLSAVQALAMIQTYLDGRQLSHGGASAVE